MKQDKLHTHPFHFTHIDAKGGGGKTLIISNLRSLFLVVFSFISCSFLCSSCEKELFRYAEIAAYHAESLTLNNATKDSLTRFEQKVNHFVTLNPAAQEDPLYPEILENINRRTGSLSMIITIHGEWAGDTTIHY